MRSISINLTVEMTSLQANQKRAAGRRPSQGQCGKEECQYTRHGTVRLTENWDVVAGQFIMPTIEQTRNNEDFAKHVERLMNSGLADGWVIVVDNLNTHCGEPLVRMIAKHLASAAINLAKPGNTASSKTWPVDAHFFRTFPIKSASFTSPSIVHVSIKLRPSSE